MGRGSSSDWPVQPPWTPVINSLITRRLAALDVRWPAGSCSYLLNNNDIIGKLQRNSSQ